MVPLINVRELRAGEPLNIGAMIGENIACHLDAGRVAFKLFGKAKLPSNITLFYFTPRDIDRHNLSINGTYFCRRRSCWAKNTFPLPDFLYLPAGLPPLSPAEFSLWRIAVDNGQVRLVNGPLEFNKWEFYSCLSTDGNLKTYLPQTALLRSYALDLAPLLRRYGGAYVKACRGRRGQQVMQVIRLPGGGFEYRYFTRKLNIRRVNGDKDLYDAIDCFFYKRQLIVQQPLDLINWQGRKIDLRAEMQRNGRGRLEVIAVPVRVGQRDSPITTHASSYRFEDFFIGPLGYSEASLAGLKQRLYSLLFKLYYAVESCYGPLGELGLDIGLDKKNRLWLIEGNPLSARVSLIKAYDAETVRRAFSNPLDYAVFAANQKELPPDRVRPVRTDY